MTKRDVQNAAPVTLYIQIWSKNLVTVFGNVMESSLQRKFAHKGTRSLET